jgi:MFS family permease
MTALVVIAFSNSYLIETRHAPASYPAYALGIYGLVKLIAAPVGGWVLDRARAGVVVAFIFAVEFAGLFVILATQTANGFLAGVALLSTGIAIAWLVVFHALGDASDGDVRATATAYVGLTSAAATATGFGLAAVIGETPFRRVVIASALILCGISTAVLFRLYPRGEPVGRITPAEELTATTRPDRNRQLIAAAVIFAHFTAVTATLAAFGPFVLRTLDLTLLRTAVLLAPAAAVGAAAMFIAGRRSKEGNRLREVGILYAIGAVTVLVAATVTNVWVFAVVAIPLALAIAGAQPLLNASLLDVSQSADRTGTVLGWMFFAEGLGSVAGPMAVAVVISASDSVRASVVTLSILYSAVVFLAVGGSRSTRL